MEWLNKLLGRTTPHIPDDLWLRCVQAMPFLARLNTAEMTKLKTLSEGFLAKIPMRGAAGFELTDLVAVTIAAQAALPVLNLTLDLYDELSAIIIYPSAFVVKNREIDAAGVVHETHQVLAGEAVHAGGAVVLSWQDISPHLAADHRRNVVIHEFAHKIDMVRGRANGFPPFLAGYHEGLTAAEWSTVFSNSYSDFQHLLQHPYHWPRQIAHDAHGMEIETPTLPMDSYGAKNPAEFFAVASESFFLTPAALALSYPELYRLLSKYYLQQPLQPV